MARGTSFQLRNVEDTELMSGVNKVKATTTPIFGLLTYANVSDTSHWASSPYSSHTCDTRTRGRLNGCPALSGAGTLSHSSYAGSPVWLVQGIGLKSS